MKPLNFSLAVETRHDLDNDEDEYEDEESLQHDLKSVTDFLSTLKIFSPDLPFIVLVVFLIFAVGALLRTVLRETKIPLLVFIFFIGISLGLIPHFHVKLDVVKTIADMDYLLFYYLFSPAVIFPVAFDMDFYIFRKSFWQVIVLAVPGFLMNCAFLAWLTYKINPYGWNWDDSMFFGIVLSITDPVLSVASVKHIGLSKIVINLIKGESLFNDATGVIILDLYRDFAKNKHSDVVKELIIKLILKFFGSTLFGFLSSRFVVFWLHHIFNDGVVEVVLSFSMVYIIFFTAEYLGMSGVIALCVLGLLLDSLSFSPGVDLFVFRFWTMITFLVHILIHLIMGIVIAQKALLDVSFRNIFNIVTTYISLNLVRAVVLLILSPFLSRLGYGFNWRWGAVIVWSGMRGTFALSMALALSQGQRLGEKDITTMLLLHSGMASMLTLIINSTTVKKMVMTLGLCTITLPKRMALHNAVQRIREMEANTFSMLKLDRFLADANWAMVEDAIKIDYPFELNSEEVYNLSKTLRCQECNTDIIFERSPQQIADLMEEARLRVLTAQMASYQKQYNSGMLNQDAAQTLIGAAESYVDIKGKFMNIHEVKTYWESKGILVKTKNLLSDWVYNVKDEKTKPRNKFLKMCHNIVFMDEFECMSTIITFLNLIPIVLNFIESVNTLFLQELRLNNFYFLGLYTLEAILKALAMGRAYFYYHWNLFELIIVVLGFVDILIIHIFKSLHPSDQVIQIVTICRVIRLLRILRLLKHVIPRVINMLDSKINQQLTFRYDIAKGYVQGEEDLKCLIGQIAGHKSVDMKLSEILETNKQVAMKELGLMQRDYPDIVIAVKTKQAVQTVLNTASETLKSMISGGIVDRNEGAELHKLILRKKKQITTLPSTIAAPTAEELLLNVIWLQNEKAHIEFIQKKAKILCYDYGDTICEENELPKGIFLIVSGMTKLHGSAPRYGVDRDFYNQIHPVGLPFTDYLVTGAIIGEVNCLTKQEMEYTVTCETAVQTCFISLEDLLEAFDRFLESPSLEYKIWMKIALDVAVKTFKESLPDQDWSYKMCMQFSNMYVMDVPNHTKRDIYNGTMDYVILVHGTVQDCQKLQRYAAPYILPKTCYQIQGTAPATKLLVIQTTEQTKRKSTGLCSDISHYHEAGRRLGKAHLGLTASEMEGSSRSTLRSDSDYAHTSTKISTKKKT